MMRRSMRARLLISVALIQIVGAAVATYLVVQHERRQSYQAFDASLGEHAAIVASLVQAPEEEVDTFIFHRELLALPQDARYRLIDSLGRTVGGSAGWIGPSKWPDAPRSTMEFVSEGTHYRALVLRDLTVVDPEPDEHTVLPKLTLVYAASTREVEAHIRGVTIKSAFACLMFLLLSTIASAWAVTWGLSPLKQLANRAAEIDAGNWAFVDFEKSRGVSELGPLANALTRLVERLHAAFERERQFFGDAAHEMKSSIAILSSTLQLALQSNRTAAEYRSGLNEALEDTDRLHRLVGSMLDLFRIEGIAKEASVEKTITEVHAQAQHVIQRLEPLTRRMGLRIILDMAAEEQWVQMSDDHLQTILTNLLENSIKYSSAGQQITVSVLTGKDECIVSVIDQGCGIAEGALPHVFERFFRSDESRSRATGGNGLGLSIARALVRKANGSISAQSTLGRGSIFSVHIPSCDCLLKAGVHQD